MPVLRAVTCITAVMYEVGLKSPGSHNENGVTKSLDHEASWACRASMSANCAMRFFIEGQEHFSQLQAENGLRPGHWLMLIAVMRSSIPVVMFSWPFIPFSSSIRDLRISDRSTFMRWH